MSKIEKLTPEQETQMIEFREEWRGHGLSTECVDTATTKEAITEMYNLIGKKPPVFIFCPSLMFAQFQIAYCKTIFKELQNPSETRANLGANLGTKLPGFVDRTHALHGDISSIVIRFRLKPCKRDAYALLFTLRNSFSSSLNNQQ